MMKPAPPRVMVRLEVNVSISHAPALSEADEALQYEASRQLSQRIHRIFARGILGTVRLKKAKRGKR